MNPFFSFLRAAWEKVTDWATPSITLETLTPGDHVKHLFENLEIEVLEGAYLPDYIRLSCLCYIVGSQSIANEIFDISKVTGTGVNNASAWEDIANQVFNPTAPDQDNVLLIQCDSLPEHLSQSHYRIEQEGQPYRAVILSSDAGFLRSVPFGYVYKDGDNVTFYATSSLSVSKASPLPDEISDEEKELLMERLCNNPRIRVIGPN